MIAAAIMKFCEWRSAAWQERAKRALDLRDWWLAARARVSRKRAAQMAEDVQ